MQHGHEDVYNLTDDMKLFVVTRYTGALRRIDAPPHNVIMAALDHDGDNICSIRWWQQTYNQRLAAAKSNGLSLRYMNPPPPAVIREQLFNMPHLSNTTRNAMVAARPPNDEIRLLALSQNGMAIEFITNPSHVMQIVAVTQNPKALLSIKSPCLEAILACG